MVGNETTHNNRVKWHSTEDFLLLFRVFFSFLISLSLSPTLVVYTFYDDDDRWNKSFKMPSICSRGLNTLTIKSRGCFFCTFHLFFFPIQQLSRWQEWILCIFSSFLFHWIKKKNKTKSRLVTHTEFFTRRAKKSWQIISCLSQQFSIKSTPSLMQRGDSAERLCIWFVRSCLDEERIEKWAFTAAIAISYKFFLPLNLSLFSSFSAVWCCLVLFTYS